MRLPQRMLQPIDTSCTSPASKPLSFQRVRHYTSQPAIQPADQHANQPAIQPTSRQHPQHDQSSLPPARHNTKQRAPIPAKVGHSVVIVGSSMGHIGVISGHVCAIVGSYMAWSGVVVEPVCESVRPRPDHIHPNPTPNIWKYARQPVALTKSCQVKYLTWQKVAKSNI